MFASSLCNLFSSECINNNSSPIVQRGLRSLFEWGLIARLDPRDLVNAPYVSNQNLGLRRVLTLPVTSVLIVKTRPCSSLYEEYKLEEKEKTSDLISLNLERLPVVVTFTHESVARDRIPESELKVLPMELRRSLATLTGIAGQMTAHSLSKGIRYSHLPERVHKGQELSHQVSLPAIIRTSTYWRYSSEDIGKIILVIRSNNDSCPSRLWWAAIARSRSTSFGLQTLIMSL